MQRWSDDAFGELTNDRAVAIMQSEIDRQTQLSYDEKLPFTYSGVAFDLFANILTQIVSHRFPSHLPFHSVHPIDYLCSVLCSCIHIACTQARWCIR
jgi:hypothetical protein